MIWNERDKRKRGRWKKNGNNHSHFYVTWTCQCEASSMKNFVFWRKKFLTNLSKKNTFKKATMKKNIYIIYNVRHFVIIFDFNSINVCNATVLIQKSQTNLEFNLVYFLLTFVLLICSCVPIEVQFIENFYIVLF